MKRFALALLIAAASSSSFASDGYQGRPSVCDNIPSGPRADRCHEWVRTAQRPDYPGASCCGEGDAFMADDFERGPNGELYAVITGDYPPSSFTDEEGNTTVTPPKYTRGVKVLIPPEKLITRPEDANRSGHGVVYLRPSNGEVLCYAPPPLI